MKNPLPYYSFEPDEKTLSKIKSFYRQFASPNANENVEIFAKSAEVTVTIYKPNKKGKSSVLFQGMQAIKEARNWDPSAKRESIEPLGKRPLAIEETAIINHYPQIGSDEVGTGDLFGPITVAAALVKEKDLGLIEELGIKDSKKLTDQHILSIGPTVIKNFLYSQLSLSNEKYNEVNVSNNMNAIKAKMHNACLLNMRKKAPLATIYQDQFASPSLYYNYLKNEKEIVKGINFHTKGESLFPSVALASVIARYSFLQKMGKLSNKYGMSFPYGSGKKVDEFLIKFIDKYGKDELRKVAKLNFSTIKNIDK